MRRFHVQFEPTVERLHFPRALSPVIVMEKSQVKVTLFISPHQLERQSSLGSLFSHFPLSFLVNFHDKFCTQQSKVSSWIRDICISSILVFHDEPAVSVISLELSMSQSLHKMIEKMQQLFPPKHGSNPEIYFFSYKNRDFWVSLVFS